jgi:hypothetical protein
LLVDKHDEEEHTLRVELRGVGLVKGNGLMPDQVFTVGQGSGDRGGPFEFLQQNAVSPVALAVKVLSKWIFIANE